MPKADDELRKWLFMEAEENAELVAAFNNHEINDDDFLKMLVDSDKKSKEFQKLQRKANKLNVK